MEGWKGKGMEEGEADDKDDGEYEGQPQRLASIVRTNTTRAVKLDVSTFVTHRENQIYNFAARNLHAPARSEFTTKISTQTMRTGQHNDLMHSLHCDESGCMIALIST